MFSTRTPGDKFLLFHDGITLDPHGLGSSFLQTPHQASELTGLAEAHSTCRGQLCIWWALALGAHDTVSMSESPKAKLHSLSPPSPAWSLQFPEGSPIPVTPHPDLLFLKCPDPGAGGGGVLQTKSGGTVPTLRAMPIVL